MTEMILEVFMAWVLATALLLIRDFVRWIWLNLWVRLKRKPPQIPYGVLTLRFFGPEPARSLGLRRAWWLQPNPGDARQKNYVGAYKRRREDNSIEDEPVIFIGE